MSKTTQGNSAQNTTQEKITKALDGVIEPGDSSRYIVSLTWDGRVSAQAVPVDAAVMSVRQLMKSINESNGTYIPTTDLEAFLEATSRRLAARADYESVQS